MNTEDPKPERIRVQYVETTPATYSVRVQYTEREPEVRQIRVGPDPAPL